MSSRAAIQSTNNFDLIILLTNHHFSFPHSRDGQINSKDLLDGNYRGIIVDIVPLKGIGAVSTGNLPLIYIGIELFQGTETKRSAPTGIGK